MSNTELIQQFYQSFARADAEGMITAYHENVVFKDPAFGKLEKERARSMWRMLLSRNNEIHITHKILETSGNTAKVAWTAIYNYGPKKRKVVNHVTAHLVFQDAKIIKHTDKFNLWNWSRQALGLSGFLLGWTPFMKKKIQQKTNSLLHKFMEDRKNP
ncbi:nuclear transport factor 2 family protein [Christiangramia sp. SM2212]|uniref:Nuclear transport factor 2 family protein n=1 Tax=Christiangramia sediminicola TaxID=3073267 RepID=A0ABU1ERL1_9FLAO|nr:nuclear transport factor 2 family protein [Christiangramia sp. SM2212]MDR5591019.1 nuclear transport factor 2 family protein [Christiangramia sp. SM2212]